MPPKTKQLNAGPGQSRLSFASKPKQQVVAAAAVLKDADGDTFLAPKMSQNSMQSKKRAHEQISSSQGEENNQSKEERAESKSPAKKESIKSSPTKLPQSSFVAPKDKQSKRLKRNDQNSPAKESPVKQSDTKASPSKPLKQAKTEQNKVESDQTKTQSASKSKTA